jgi:hypothetical protein
VLVPLAMFSPAEESVVLRSVGIWASPVEVICLRLVAAPLWAGLQFYANLDAFQSLIPYDRRFQAVLSGRWKVSFPPFCRAIIGIPGDRDSRYRIFFFQPSFSRLFRPDPALKVMAATARCEVSGRGREVKFSGPGAGFGGSQPRLGLPIVVPWEH